MMKTGFWTALALAGSALALAGCGGSEAEAPVAANPDAPAGIAVTDGRMNLPAVEGNPGAVYFTVENSSDRDQTVRAVSVAGAESTVMHQTAEWSGQMDMQEVFQLSIPAGETLVLEPGGLHVMAMGVSPDLAAGGETEVTLTFVGGDKASFPARVMAAGEGMDDGAEAAADGEES